MVAQNVAFWIIAIAMVLSAIGVVRTSNVVHAALYLVIVLAGAAAQYILLAAEFGIMLTRSPMGDLDLDNSQRMPAFVASLALVGTLTALLVDAFGNSKVVIDAPTKTSVLSSDIFRLYIVPFEAVSILLLAALVGAIVLARRD